MTTNLASVWEEEAPRLTKITRKRVERLWVDLIVAENSVNSILDLQPDLQDADRMARAKDLISDLDGGPVESGRPCLETMADNLKEIDHPDAPAVTDLSHKVTRIFDNLYLVASSRHTLLLPPHDPLTTGITRILTDEGYTPDQISVRCTHIGPYGDYLVLSNRATDASQAAEEARHLYRSLSLSGLRVWRVSHDPRLTGAGPHPVAVEL